MNNCSYPELLCVDTMCAQVEAVARDLLSLASHQMDFSKQMSNALRCCNCALSVLEAAKGVAHTHERLDEADLSGVAQWIGEARAALQAAASKLVCAFTAKAASDFGMELRVVGLDASDADVKDDCEDGPFSTEVAGIGKCGDDSGKCKEMAIRGCNLAHRMQSTVSSLIRLAPVKAQATKVIQVAGQSENHLRAVCCVTPHCCHPPFVSQIQAQVKQFEMSDRTHHDPKTLAVNLEKSVTQSGCGSGDGTSGE